MVRRDFDVVVIGAGHAGCEAAHAAARLGARVLMTCINKDSVGFLACNPSIGGVGKSHLVYEIDALGGLMGRVADECCIQMRMLNRTNGPAVRAHRAQVDRHRYHRTMLSIINKTKGITLRECEVTEIIADKAVTAVKLSNGESVTARAVVVASGVYLNSITSRGTVKKDEGPAGFARSGNLTRSLQNLGVRVRRFSTSTPPRLVSGTIDYSQTTPQAGDTDTGFSFLTRSVTKDAIQCHITHTNTETHKVIRDAVQNDDASMGAAALPAGPRYCPSVEDKVIRFPDVARHQIFLEPEGIETDDVYLGGMTTGLSADVQKCFVETVAGLHNAQISKPGYAIEYDCIDSTQLLSTLEYKQVKGLFFAGQVNGTSGYEEAAAQGLVAGINAVRGGAVFSRTDSYIGVLIDDLVTLGTNEPYRMFTSRAEYRLNLRPDNADRRLTPFGREIGLVDDERWRVFQEKMALLEHARQGREVPPSIREILETERLYEGYMEREAKKIAETRRCEQTLLPQDLDYTTVTPLKKEAQEKLNLLRPQNIAQAMRISGVTPADISILLVWLKKYYFSSSSSSS